MVIVRSLGALVAAALLAGCGTVRSSEPAQSEAIAAEVGKDTVTVGEVEALLNEARPIFRKRGRVFPAEDDPYYADLRDEAVRYLVERRLREQMAEELGIDVSEARRGDNLDVDTYREISDRRKDDETVREALARYRELLEGSFGRVEYAPGFEPAVHRRSIPPELRKLAKPKAKCDLEDGMYPFFVARAHGCLSPGDSNLKYIAPPCPEVPASEIDLGLTDGEVNSGYADYVMSGTAAHDFFEPLTTNKEELASEENPEGPECQSFPGESMVSVGDVGFRSIPAPRRN